MLKMHQRLCITSTLVTNQGFKHMNQKQKDKQLYGSSKFRRNQQKLFAEEAHRHKWLLVSLRLKVIRLQWL